MFKIEKSSSVRYHSSRKIFKYLEFLTNFKDLPNIFSRERTPEPSKLFLEAFRSFTYSLESSKADCKQLAYFKPKEQLDTSKL